MSAAAIALADLRQVHHLCRVGFGPRIRSHRDLGAKARLRQADRVGGMGIQVVRDELVEPFQRMVGDIEEDRPVALFGAAADQFQGLLVPLQQRRQQPATNGCSALRERHLCQQRNQPRNKLRVLRRLDDQRQLHRRRRHLHRRFRTLILCAVHNVGPMNQVSNRRGVEAEAVEAMWAIKLVQDM